MKHPINAPKELKSQNYWINWKLVNGAKVPCLPSGASASVTDPNNWISYEDALNAYNKNTHLAGIGFVFDVSNGYMGVDFDYCMDPSGKLNPAVEQLLTNYYGIIDISPSGQGVKLILKGKKPSDITLCKVTGVLDSKAVEWYDHGRFFTFTGNSYNRSLFIEDGAELSERLRPYFTSPTGTVPTFTPPNGSAPNWIALTANLHEEVDDKDPGSPPTPNPNEVTGYVLKGRASQNEADMGLCFELAMKYPFDYNKVDEEFRKSDLMRPKWDEPRGVLTYGQRTMVKVMNSIPLKGYTTQLKYLIHTYEFRYNTVACTIEYRRHGGVFTELGDQEFNSILNEIRSRGGTIYSSYLREMINQTDMAPKYDPLREYFESLPKWDGVDYLSQLTRCISTTNNSLRDLLVKRWLLGLVATIMKDAVNQGCLILKGGQGLGKTSFITRLLPESMREYYYSGTIREESKDTLMLMVRKLIINMDELASLHRKESSSLKELITKDEITYRAPYGTVQKQYRRNASFIGSVNSASFLNDDTGSRRFWILDCTAIDWKAMPDMNMVYSQIMYLLESGERWWLNHAEQNQVEASNKSFSVPSLEEELLELYTEVSFDRHEFALVELADSLSRCSGHPVSQINRTKLKQALINKAYPSVTKNGKVRYKLRVRVLPDLLK